MADTVKYKDEIDEVVDREIDRWLEAKYGPLRVQWQQVGWAVAAIALWLVGATGIVLLGYAAYRMVQVIV